MIGKIKFKWMEAICNMAKKQNYLVTKENQIRGIVLHTLGMNALYNRTIYFEHEMSSDTVIIFAGSKKIGYVEKLKISGAKGNLDDHKLLNINKDMEKIENDFFNSLIKVKSYYLMNCMSYLYR